MSRTAKSEPDTTGESHEPVSHKEFFGWFGFLHIRHKTHFHSRVWHGPHHERTEGSGNWGAVSTVVPDEATAMATLRRLTMPHPAGLAVLRADGKPTGASLQLGAAGKGVALGKFAQLGAGFRRGGAEVDVARGGVGLGVGGGGEEGAESQRQGRVV